MFSTIKDWFLNKTLYRNIYHYSSDSVIIACYFNFKKNPYRKLVFDIWYNSIKHLNHRIIECVLEGDVSELNEGVAYKTIYTSDVLWHKEALLNIVIRDLPKKYKYVFWCDTDVILTNKKWLVDAAKVLKTTKLIQPFSGSKHLTKSETDNFDKTIKNTLLVDSVLLKSITTTTLSTIKASNIKSAYLPSFGYNHVVMKTSSSEVYTEHGHVGFIWGVQRCVLNKVKLYDKALVGGADHVMAHCALGEIDHKCNSKLFDENMSDIMEWGYKFHKEINGSLGFVNSGLLHLWHGDLEKRDYYHRIKNYSKELVNYKTKTNGLYVKNDPTDNYVDTYLASRENVTNYCEECDDVVKNNSLIDSLMHNAGASIMGLAIADLMDDEAAQESTLTYIEEMTQELIENGGNCEINNNEIIGS